MQEELSEKKRKKITSWSYYNGYFSYFINNSPRDLDVYGEVDGKWVPMAEKMRVKPWAGNRLRINCKTTRTKKVRLRLFPDGGINRFKVFGVPVSHSGLENNVD